MCASVDSLLIVGQVRFHLFLKCCSVWLFNNHTVPSKAFAAVYSHYATCDYYFSKYPLLLEDLYMNEKLSIFNPICCE